MSNANEEWAGLDLFPRIPSVIDGFKYPTRVQSLIKKMNAAFDEWAEADTALAVAVEDLDEAKALDGKIFAESVLNGTDDPGEVHTPSAARKVKGARILVNAKRVAVNKLGRIVDDAMREHAREITLTAIADARVALARREEILLEASKLINQANDVRTHGLLGLREIASYTRGTYQFDPSFPVQGNVSLPETSETRVRQICDDLDRLIESGALFADDDSGADIEQVEAEAVA